MPIDYCEFRKIAERFCRQSFPHHQSLCTDADVGKRQAAHRRKNPLKKGIIMENAAGIGTVTAAMVEARARELTAINGRPSSEPSGPSDRSYERS
jgi:hypothetical protein